MKNSKKIVIILVSILLIFAIGCLVYFKFVDKNVTFDDYTIYKGTIGKVEDYDSSKVVEGYKGGDRAYYITGRVSSFNKKGLTVILFNLYDKNNKNLGTAKAVIDNMEANKKYEFKAVSLVEAQDVSKITHYKLKSIEER